MSASHPAAHNRRQAGFSLLELMIAVAVVALLLGVALPSFMDAMRKSRRSDAIDAITKVQQAQERWRSSNRAYSTDFDALRVRSSSERGHYNLAIAAEEDIAVGYRVTATATGAQANDTRCATMAVTVVRGAITYIPDANNCFAK